MRLQTLTLIDGYVVSQLKVDVFIGNGQRSCLVNDHGVHAAELLHSRGVLNEDAPLRRLSNAHHKGCGRGKSHGAGTGNDQNGHR